MKRTSKNKQQEIFEEAVGFYEQGLVTFKGQKEGVLHFEVDGKQVVIHEETEEVLHCDCKDCTPYADCVHAVAALMYLGELQAEDEEEEDQEFVDPEIIDLVDETDYEFVKQFACAILHDSPELLEMFKQMRAERDEQLEDIAGTSFMHTLRVLFARYSNMDNGYYNVDGLLDDLDAIVDEEARDLQTEEQMISILDMMSVVHIYLQALDENYMERINMSYNHMLDYVRKFSRKLKGEDKDQLFAQLKEIVSEYMFGAYTHLAEDVFVEEFSEAKYLEDKIDVCYEKLNERNFLDDGEMSDLLYSRWMSSIVTLFLQAGHSLEYIKDRIEDEYDEVAARAILIEVGKYQKEYTFVREVLNDSMKLDQAHPYLVKKYEKELVKIKKMTETHLN